MVSLPGERPALPFRGWLSLFRCGDGGKIRTASQPEAPSLNWSCRTRSALQRQLPHLCKAPLAVPSCAHLAVPKPPPTPQGLSSATWRWLRGSQALPPAKTAGGQTLHGDKGSPAAPIFYRAGEGAQKPGQPPTATTRGHPHGAGTRGQRWPGATQQPLDGSVSPRLRC